MSNTNALPGAMCCVELYNMYRQSMTDLSYGILWCEDVYIENIQDDSGGNVNIGGPRKHSG